MKTLYALALICLSVPAFASELDFDGRSNGYAAETGYWYDIGADFNGNDENTATIIVPPAPKSEDYSLKLGFDLDDGTVYQDEAVDVDAIAFDAWF